MSGGIATATLLPDLPKRRRDESIFQRSVHQYLRWALPDHACHHSIPNGLMRSKKAGAAAVGEGLAAGTPDIEVVWCGYAIYLELKTPKGALSAAQKQRHRKLIHCGAVVLVCRTLDDVYNGLTDCGVPLKARPS